MPESRQRENGLHFTVSDLAPAGPPDTTIRVGCIVTLHWEKKRIHAKVLSWSGNLDGHVRLVDLRLQIHRRYFDSLIRELDTDALAILDERFAELLTSKKGQAALKAPVVSEWGPISGTGATQRCDIPYVLADRIQGKSWHTSPLLNYVSGPSDRQILRRARGCGDAMYLEGLRQDLKRQPGLMQVLAA